MQVKNDRLTLSFTDVPQIYLSGVIDANAPQRFAALVASRKIPNGSDVYLNSSGGSVIAALALGRLFRSSLLVTHVGAMAKRKPALNTALCEGACAYAYVGGLYRWATTGKDRIGLSAVHSMDSDTSGNGQAQDSPDAVVSYLKEMGVDPSVFAPTLAAPRYTVMWLSADQMLSSGLANNGRLPLTAKYQPSSGAPYLMLDQVDRHGEHRIAIECKLGSLTLTAYNVVGAARAREIVARGARSYFELNQQEILTQQRDGADVNGESVTMTRSYPESRIGYLLFARSIGAWVTGRNSAFRYGFTFDLEPVRSTLKEFYRACWIAAPWQTAS